MAIVCSYEEVRKIKRVEGIYDVGNNFRFWRSMYSTSNRTGPHFQFMTSLVVFIINELIQAVSCNTTFICEKKV